MDVSHKRRNLSHSTPFKQTIKYFNSANGTIHIAPNTIKFTVRRCQCMFVNKTISRTSTVKTLCIVAIQIREILHRSCHHKSYAGNHFLTILSKFHRFRRISFLRKSKIYRKPSTRSINRNRFISHQSTGSRLNHNLQLIFLNGSRIIDIGKLKNLQGFH